MESSIAVRSDVSRRSARQVVGPLGSETISPLGYANHDGERRER